MGTRFLAPLAAASAAVLLVSCSTAVKVGSQAVDDTAGALNVAARTVELSSDDVSRLASQAGVVTDDIETVAPTLHQQQRFDDLMLGLTRLERSTDGEVRDVTLSVACDALNGEVSSESELHEALAGALQGLTQSELTSVATGTVELWRQLYDASLSPEPSVRATVAITCYTAQTLS